MGQYWMLVNVDKNEFVHPHKLGCGLKLWEQLANHPSTGTAMIVLLAAMPEPRGGGDFDLESNWHGPERAFPEHNASPGPMPEAYPVIAKRTIGRWCGDRVVLLGDYAEDSDAEWTPRPASMYYGDESMKDITDDVCAVIEHELRGKFQGEGWREFVYNDKQVESA